MRFKLLLIWLFIFSMVSVPAFAQLGPKDGASLPATDLERVKIGQAAPDFTLEDMTGKRISLSDFRGKKNVVLVFYRGHW
jgi:cytochrome oxidase Cu insertion factor (SCO1/SenC/PrrC family)